MATAESTLPRVQASSQLRLHTRPQTAVKGFSFVTICLSRYFKIDSSGASTFTVRYFSASPRFKARMRWPAHFLTGS